MKLAIWKHLVRPLMPWIGRLVVAVLASVAIAWVGGSFVIRRAEPERVGTLPAGVAGRMVVVGGRPVHVVEQ